jgi:hypothetical protein
MVQFAPAARLDPQEFANTNDEAFAPVTAMLVIVIVDPLVLVIVTLCEALLVPTYWAPNERLVGDSVTGGAPVPLRLTGCVEPLTLPELSVTVSVAVKLPDAAAGVKLTEMVQLLPAATVVPQLFVCPKSLAFVPLMATLATVNGPVPVLLSVTDCAALVVPTVWAANVSEVGETPAVGDVPVPLSVTFWVAPTLPELSITCSVALRLPTAVGSNVTEIVQFAPTAKLAAQVLVSAKSAEFVPPITMLVIVRGPVPVLVRVTVCALVVTPTLMPANVRLLGEAPATGIPTPVPLSEAVCVEPVTLPVLSVTVSVALRLPGAVGVNVTEIVQFAPTATLVPQVLVCAKSPGLVPVMAMLAIVSGPVPELVSVTVCALAVTPTFVLLNGTTVGESPAVGTPAPVPLSETVCVFPDTLLALSVIVTVAVRVPEAAGLNVTEMVQLVPAMRVAPHVFVSA